MSDAEAWVNPDEVKTPGLRDAVARRLEDLDLDSGTDDDRLYFERQRRRSYRARLATAGELDEMRLMAVALGAEPMPEDMVGFTVVWQVKPGVRERRVGGVPPLYEDVDEFRRVYADVLRRMGDRQARTLYRALGEGAPVDLGLLYGDLLRGLL